MATHRLSHALPTRRTPRRSAGSPREPTVRTANPGLPLSLGTLTAALAEMKRDLKNDLRNEMRSQLKEGLEELRAETDGPGQQANSPDNSIAPPLLSGGDESIRRTVTQQYTSEPKLKLTPFSGDDKIRVGDWLRLFERLCARTGVVTNEEKMSLLMAYLKDEALAFYSTDIAPDDRTLTWEECSQRFEYRFGTGEVEPMSAARKRSLRGDETVKQYYDAKVAVLRRTGINAYAMCTLLTEGLPERYQPYFVGRKLESALLWLELAQSVETALTATDNRRRLRDNNTGQTVGRQTTAGQQPTRQRNRSPPPPTPCRICQQRGIDAYHWQRKCPNRWSKTETQLAITDGSDGSRTVRPDSTYTVPANYPPGESLNSLSDQN